MYVQCGYQHYHLLAEVQLQLSRHTIFIVIVFKCPYMNCDRQSAVMSQLSPYHIYKEANHDSLCINHFHKRNTSRNHSYIVFTVVQKICFALEHIHALLYSWVFAIYKIIANYTVHVY